LSGLRHNHLSNTVHSCQVSVSKFPVFCAP
jgi:hypothetical protein